MAISLKDNFEKLKLAIVGTKTTKIDQKLDKAIDDISNYRAKSGRNGYIDLVRSIIGKSTSGFSIDQQSGSGLFNQGTSPASFGQGARIARYRTYISICSMISYCFRALSVLTDNIISPDDISKFSLDVKPRKFLNAEDDIVGSKILPVKETIKKLKIEQNLHMIVKNTLLFGDFFCEIANTKTALTSRAFLSEQQSIKEGQLDIFEVGEHKISIDYTAMEAGFETMLNEDKKSSENNETLKNIVLVYHEPDKIVKLQSELFPLCFGYLVFPRTTYSQNSNVQDMPVNDICLSIIKSIEKKIPQIKEFNTKELNDIVQSMVQAGVSYEKMLSIRFVPPNRMQHFSIPSTKYYPYGESIFDSCQYTSKVLIALETALAVQRLNRSTEKRKVSVEIGLPRDARKMIEGLKEEFRKRKISLDSFGSIDTIPSMVSTFEDIYIPMKDGKNFVNVESFSEGNVDTRSKVDELNFLRDQTIAGLGVPPGFLNIEENINAKATLAEENILFARTIVGHQKYLTHQITNLVQKVYDIIDPEEALTLIDNVSISFPPPKSLQFEREARYISELANLIETLERVGIPKAYTTKKYLTNFDWEEMKNYEIDEKIEKSIGTTKDEDGGLAGGGGMSF